MNSNPRKHGASSPKNEESSRTTADSTPALAGVIENMSAGEALEKQLSRAFSRLGQPFDAAGVSLSWLGAERLVTRLNELGCYLEIQTSAGQCYCRVLHVLKGNALAKQLASMQAPSLPEAVAKAALLTLVEMQPPPPLPK
ncbi:MAG TPA: hypothetical protein VMI06_19425 [Terriglobia bacterium]|nr:hypothetical protein [Terriglobia bacterium]